MDSSPPGSSILGILQARILEWVAISSSRGSSWPRDRTGVSYVSCIGRWILYHWATWESQWIKDVWIQWRGKEENCPYWKFTACFLCNFHKNLGLRSGCFPRKAQDGKWTLEEIQIGAFCGVRCGWPGSVVTGPVGTFKAQQTFTEDLQRKNQERDHGPMKDLKLSVTWFEPFLSPAMLVPPALDGWGYWVCCQKKWESLRDQGPIHTSSHGLQWRKQFEISDLGFF